MLSILIPTYNYDVSKLVFEIHKQATKANIIFEIICFDDKSEKYTFKNKTTIDRLPHTKIIISEENLGRTNARQELSNASVYNWLLFLDADVIPKNSSFIRKYIDQISTGNEAVFGGLTYSDEKPANDFMLRWKYGKVYESINAEKRNLKPYQVIVSGCFLIKKTIFNKINSKIIQKKYGLDNYFAALLKKNNISVWHINNMVYHLGLEKNSVYLKKAEETIATLLWMYYEEKMIEHDNKLLTIFIHLKKFKLNYPMMFFYKILNTTMKKNLVGNKPNIFLLQIYKLSYICYKDLNS